MGGVYDVTEFTGHPGGYGRLEMVAGCDLEPFWKVYTQHNRGHILEVLQRYKIGWLSDEEAEEQVRRERCLNNYHYHLNNLLTQTHIHSAPSEG